MLECIGPQRRIENVISGKLSNGGLKKRLVVHSPGNFVKVCLHQVIVFDVFENIVVGAVL